MDIPRQSDCSGMAAVTICEALPLTVNDHKILPKCEVMGVLEDAATAHENAAGPTSDLPIHRAVAAFIEGIIAGRNSARRSTP